MVPEAINQHMQELEDKIKKGQVQVFEWKELKKRLPRKLKLSLSALEQHSALWNFGQYPSWRVTRDGANLSTV